VGVAMDLLDQYFELQQKIYDYFGYKEGWCVFPIADTREYSWFIKGGSGFNRHVIYCKGDFTVRAIADGKFWQEEIERNVHFPQLIYDGEEFTMIVIDACTDDNGFLRIFDNSRQLVSPPDEILKAIEAW